jgi:uncharacterized protein YukE
VYNTNTHNYSCIDDYGEGIYVCSQRCKERVKEAEQDELRYIGEDFKEMNQRLQREWKDTHKAAVNATAVSGQPLASQTCEWISGVMWQLRHLATPEEDNDDDDDEEDNDDKDEKDDNDDE